MTFIDTFVSWRGNGFDYKSPHVWVPDRDFVFGNKQFVAHIPVAQFETANYGWTKQLVKGKMTVGHE